ncbi:MAG: primosomal protein [Bacilli bacterium]|nr:primosomal protein [Bacilli bacterium]
MNSLTADPVFCQVALDVPTVALDKPYSYAIPKEYAAQIAVGSRVTAPFRNKQLHGYVLSFIDEPDIAKDRIKPLLDVLPDYCLPDEFMRLTEWMRGRYLTSYASILKTFTPPIVRPKRTAWVEAALPSAELQEWMDKLSGRLFKQKQIVSWLLEQEAPVLLTDALHAVSASRSTFQTLAAQGVLRTLYKDEYRSPLSSKEEMLPPERRPLVLTDEQQAAILELNTAIHSGHSGQFLLQGVTGSGKTEVYLQAIETCLQLGKSAIALVPEISLTPQLVSRFVGRFKELVAVLHSRMSDGERFDEWRRIRSGEARVVIGARSAVFAPCEHIGLLIIDEEHETSYKQEDHPKYHTREIALFRTKYHQALLVQGSATPSLETRFAAQTGRIRRLLLTKRALGNPLPEVEIVNLCEEASGGSTSLFSAPMQKELRNRLATGEQSILFLNRRGYASSLLCQKCGYVPRCHNCAVSLTYHHAYRPRALCCHYCGYAEEASLRCANCGSDHMKQFGVGTERVETELAALFPEARILRMDVDTTRLKGSHERLLAQFRAGQADILLGTQMIAKGHDFPNVSFVGVLSADTALHLPDVRAAERTFQLLTQVAGRAGRHQLPGKVIVQSFHPDHYAIRLAAKQDYEAFYQQELADRQAMHNPPFWEISLITVTHEDMSAAVKVAGHAASELQKLLAGESAVIVHDPVPAPIERLHGKHRVHITLRYQRFRDLQPVLAGWYPEASQQATQQGAYLSVDINAQWVV